MSEEDIAERKTHAVAHHLPLGALATLEQQGLALSRERQAGHIPFDGRTGGRRAQKSDIQHER